MLGIAAGQPELPVLALGAVALLLMQVIQHLLCLLPVLLRLLPGQVQRLQASCRLTGGQALQFTGCLVTSLLGLLQSESRLLPLLLGLLQRLTPTALGLQSLLPGQQRRLLQAQTLLLGLQLGALRFIEQLHALGAAFQHIECLFGSLGALVDLLGYLPVNLGAGQLLQQLGALVGIGFEKRRKAALGQQHGLGEALEIEAGQLSGETFLLADLVGEYFAIGDTCQLDLGRLQRTVDLVARAALAPEGAVALPLDLELDLGQAVGGMPRHQLVATGRQRAHARRAVVQRQANGVEQGGLARTGRPGDGEQAATGERLGSEVDLPLALEGIEVLEAQAEDFHAQVVSRWRRSFWHCHRRRAGSIAAIALAAAHGQAVLFIQQPFHAGSFAVGGADALHHAIAHEDDLRALRTADEATRAVEVGDGQAVVSRRAADIQVSALWPVPTPQPLLGGRYTTAYAGSSTATGQQQGTERQGRSDDCHGDVLVHGCGLGGSTRFDVTGFIWQLSDIRSRHA